MILKYLAEKDEHWRYLARCICKDSTLADELVQNLYLRVYEYDIDEKLLTDQYMYRALFNCFKEWLRTRKEFYDISDYTESKGILYKGEEENIGYDDYETIITSCLKDYEKEMLIENYSKSATKIGEETETNRKVVCSRLNSLRKKALGAQDYDLFRNSRMKYNNKK